MYFSPPLLEERDRFIAFQHRALERGGGGDDLAHLGFDGREILRRERLVAGEVVIETILDRRPDRHLRSGIQRLHRLREDVCRIVADHLQRLGIAARDEDYGGVVLDRGGEVDQLAVELHGERGFREAGPDVRGDGGTRDRPGETARGTVGQGDGGHVGSILLETGEVLWRHGSSPATLATVRSARSGIAQHGGPAPAGQAGSGESWVRCRRREKHDGAAADCGGDVHGAGVVADGDFCPCGNGGDVGQGWCGR